MKLDSIHHIAIIVSDYEVSKDFYVNKLGFEIVRENFRPERGDVKLDLRVNENTELEIFGRPDAPRKAPGPEPLGLRHLAFRVKNIDEVIAELNSKGIEVEPVRTDDYTHERMTFFKDPDGLPLELHE